MIRGYDSGHDSEHDSRQCNMAVVINSVHAILGNTSIVFQPEVQAFQGDFPVLNFGVTLAVVSLRFWNYERDGIFTYMDGRFSW